MSLFDTATIGTPNNFLTFNNYGSFPLYRALSRAPQQRQLRELDIPLPFESGISDFNTLIGRMAYVIEGKMYPSGEADFSTGLAALRKLASLDFEQADTSADEGYVPYIYTENGSSRQIFLKVLYVDAPESTRQGLIQPFRLVCKIKDPTIFGYPAKAASTQSTNPTLVGGSAGYPFGYPIGFGMSTYSVTSNAVNSGTVPVYPQSIIIQGPINTPTITNSATGQFITVNQNLSSSSDVMIIIYDKDSLSITLNGVSCLSSVTAQSTYFKLQPGSNGITLTGSTLSSGAYVVVNFLDGYALS